MELILKRNATDSDIIEIVSYVVNFAGKKYPIVWGTVHEDILGECEAIDEVALETLEYSNLHIKIIRKRE